MKPAFDALSTVDGQCCQGGLDAFDMGKGPSRRCHPSYRHPLGQPLNLTLVNGQDKREAALVDPFKGDVLFFNPATRKFESLNKNGDDFRCLLFSIFLLSRKPRAEACEKFSEDKSKVLCRYYAPMHREVITLPR